MFLKLFLKGYKFFVTIPLFFGLMVCQSLVPMLLASHPENKVLAELNTYRYAFGVAAVSVFISAFYSKMEEINGTDCGVLRGTQKFFLCAFFWGGGALTFYLEHRFSAPSAPIYLRSFIFFYCLAFVFGAVVSFQYAWLFSCALLLFFATSGTDPSGNVVSWNVIYAPIGSTSSAVITIIPLVAALIIFTTKRKPF
jgi:hypothetical protein